MSKNSLATQIRLNLVDLMQQAADPSAGGGIAAAIGSFYLRSGTGQAWLKTGAGNTAWKKLQQSFGWYSVVDFGARGDAATDDTASVQAAINACATAGGGVVFFPEGEYRCSQLTINAQNGVQLRGCGTSSIIRWTFNAAGAAGSLLTITGSSNTSINELQFNGAGLTNPAASRLNHLIAVGNGGANDVATTHIRGCLFTGMVANSGDGVHVLGTAAHPVLRTWIKRNRFDGCSRFGVCIEQGATYAWVNNNFLTACETEIAVVATAAVANIGIEVVTNIINHTSVTVRHGLRVEGDAGTVSKSVVVAQNVVLTGFVTLTGLQYAVFTKNVVTSGDFASADAAVRVTGNVTFSTVQGNTLIRTSNASVGPVLSLERAGGVSPNIVGMNQNMLINEKTGGNLVTIVDCTGWTCESNVCHCANAGATNYGIDVQQTAVALTDALIGPGNKFTAAAGSFAACVRLLVNGADITDCSIVGNQGDNCDFGIRCEDAGAGSFNGQLLFGTNNFDATTGDIQQVGTTIRPNIGFNAGTAGTVGPQCRQGTGSPEGVISARIGSIYLRTDGGQATTLYYKETGTGNTGWVAVGGWMITFGTSDVGAASTALFIAPGYIAAASATEMQMPVTRAGTMRNLRLNTAVAGTGAATNTYTVRKNGSNTALAVTQSNTATGQVSETSSSVTLASGDLISLQVTKSAGVVAGSGFVVASVEIV